MTHNCISNSYKRGGSWSVAECATDWVYGRNWINQWSPAKPYNNKIVQSLKSCSNQKLNDVIFHRLFSILLSHFTEQYFQIRGKFVLFLFIWIVSSISCRLCPCGLEIEFDITWCFRMKYVVHSLSNKFFFSLFPCKFLIVWQCGCTIHSDPLTSLCGVYFA